MRNRRPGWLLTLLVLKVRAVKGLELTSKTWFDRLTTNGAP